MGLNGGAPLVPEGHGKSHLLLHHGGKGPVQLRPWPFGAVHVPWKPHHQLLNAVLPGQPGQLVGHGLRPVALDNGGVPCQEPGGVRYGDACPGVAVINGHNTHQPRVSSRSSAYTSKGMTPTFRSASSPFLKRMTVGTLITP